MRQVTGKTNPSTTDKKVSIQLALDGHSFSMATATGMVAYDEACSYETVELLTWRTVLVPKQLFQAEYAASLMAAEGMTLAADERIVLAEEPQRSEHVAVMACTQEVAEIIDAMVARGARVTTPLLHTPTFLGPTVWICDTGYLIYIKVYTPAFAFAEALPAGDEDLHCLLQRLAERCELSKYTLQLDCRHTRKERRKLYKNYFKKIVCE